MDSRNRLLLIAAVVGLALAAPYLMPHEETPATPSNAPTPKAEPKAKAEQPAAPAAPRALTADQERARERAERLLRLETDDLDATVTSRTSDGSSSAAWNRVSSRCASRARASGAKPARRSTW